MPELPDKAWTSHGGQAMWETATDAKDKRIFMANAASQIFVPKKIGSEETWQNKTKRELTIWCLNDTAQGGKRLVDSNAFLAQPMPGAMMQLWRIAKIISTLSVNEAAADPFEQFILGIQ